MAGLRDTIKAQFENGDYLIKVVLIMIGAFLIQTILGVLSTFTETPLLNYFENYTYLPSEVTEFAFKPWTLFTYMFLHHGFFHIFFNLIILYFTGKIFVDFLNDKRFLATFILGGLAGGVLFILSYNVFPFFEGVKLPLVGASAGVMAIVIGTAAYAPNLPVRLFFAIEAKLWHVASLFLLMDLLQIEKNNPGGHIAHIGGALMGYFIVRQLQNGKDYSMGFFEYWKAFFGWFDKKPTLKTVHKSKTKKRDNPKKTDADQEVLDRILEKIQKSGYDKLSKEEKEFLFKFGKK